MANQNAVSINNQILTVILSEKNGNVNLARVLKNTQKNLPEKFRTKLTETLCNSLTKMAASLFQTTKG